MAIEEKRAWIMVVVTIIGYATYLALGLASFWIANVIYLAFVLSSILAAIAKIIAYRRGFQSW